MGRHSAMYVAGVVAVLAAGCSGQPTPTGAGSARPAGATSPAPTPATSPARTPQAEGAKHGRLHLLPAPCRRGDVTVAPGTRISPATGEHGQTFQVRLRGSRACTLWGTPRVRLLDSRGRVMPFLYRHHGTYTSNAPAGPVVVRDGHPGVFQVAKYRCDVTRDAPVAHSARIGLPFVRGIFQLPIPTRGGAGIPLCGKQDPPQTLEVSRIRGSYAQLVPGEKPPSRAPYAVSMRSPFSSPSGASYGRGDLNGDGHPDLVVVRESGLVTARISGVGLRRLRLRPDQTLRLQAISTLGQGPRAYVLAAASAHGCCGYYLNASAATVIGLRQGRLGIVGTGHGPWYADFDAGVGDLFQGLVCSSAAVVEVSVLMTGPHRLKVQRRRLRLDGLRVGSLSRRSSPVPGGFQQAMLLSRSHCPGMGSRGWVSVAAGR